MRNNSYNLVVPTGIKPYPDKYELTVADLCAKWFHSDIVFITPGTKTTPDIKVLGTNETWEIKNIRGNGKYTVRDNLRKAGRQSSRVIISLLKPTTISPKEAEARIRFYLRTTKTPIKRVLLITKQREIIDIK